MSPFFWPPNPPSLIFQRGARGGDVKVQRASSYNLGALKTLRCSPPPLLLELERGTSTIHTFLARPVLEEKKHLPGERHTQRYATLSSRPFDAGTKWMATHLPICTFGPFIASQHFHNQFKTKHIHRSKKNKMKTVRHLPLWWLRKTR